MSMSLLSEKHDAIRKNERQILNQRTVIGFSHLLNPTSHDHYRVFFYFLVRFI